MIILDTNVVSELTKPLPEPRVIAWMNAQILENLHLTSISVAELRFGVLDLPEGKRRLAVEAAFNSTLALFQGRILPFDQSAALAYADFAATTKSAGRVLGLADAFIAAIAISRQWLLATRDTAILDTVQTSTINPWIG